MPRIAPDANDVIVHYLDNITTTRTNIGTIGASANFTDYGDPVDAVPGLVGANGSFYIPGPISSNKDGTSGGNTVSVTPNFSVSCWVYVRRITNTFQAIVNKQYTTGVWSSPFIACGLYTNNTNDGRWIAYITTSGSLKSIIVPANYPIPVGRWAHIGETWDGTTLRAYLNGSLVGTTVPGGGAVDYGSNPGPWFVGCIPDTATNDSPYIIVQDVRIANVTRPQSYFANIYYNGFMP